MYGTSQPPLKESIITHIRDDKADGTGLPKRLEKDTLKGRP